MSLWAAFPAIAVGAGMDANRNAAVVTNGTSATTNGSGAATRSSASDNAAHKDDAVNEPLLPKEFAGWKLSGQAHTVTAPAQVDSTAADLLAEDGFTDGATATYVRADRKLTLKAARFKDASGAYSAFTFYDQGNMRPEAIGDAGAFDGTRVLFFKGNIVVDAAFNKLSVMSASELRELADVLPAVQGPNAGMPVIQKYLPRQSFVGNSLRYFFGPVGLERSNLALPQQTIDFQQGAELASGQYTTEAGEGTLVLLSYPTPQIAEERKKAFEALPQIPELNFAKDAGFQVKRSGPLLAITLRGFSNSEARELLASVNYDADVTWNEDTGQRKAHEYAVWVISLIALVAVFVMFALVSGLAFGGLRVLTRYLQGRPLDGSDKEEFISLNLGK